MQGENRLIINWSVPSFVNICVDEQNAGELAGRFYHKYDKNPAAFAHFMDMVKQMEQLFDAVAYPQATVHERSFFKEEKRTVKKKDLTEVWSSQELGENRGRLATFYVTVKGRANASWQGEVVWVEQGISKKFRSVMELMILMDNAINR